MAVREQRLSRINTCWQEVRAAHADRDLPEGRAAMWQLLERYGGAVERYLLGAVHNEELAQELAQEFAVEFLKGAVKGADPQRGRFREFVKGIIQHLIAHHFRKDKRRPINLHTDFPERADTASPDGDPDQAFINCWRDELLARAWLALADLEERTGQPYHRVLRHKADHPEESSEETARSLSAQLGKSISAPAARKALQRAREKFADLLLEDLRSSMQDSAPDALEQELIDLRLYEYCRPALERRQ